jgi:predicted DNA-binding transcriptional regulator AlpA
MNLAGITEIATMLGVSKQRASQLVASKGFPAPLERLAAGPVWRRSAVERWAEKVGRTCA